MGKELTKTEQRITGLLTRVAVKNSRLVEIQNSTAAFVVGCVFIVNGFVYDKHFATIYHDIDFLPFWVYGALLVAAAVLHWLTLIFSHTLVRENILLIKGAMWWFLAFVVLHTTPFDVEGYCYAIFGVSALLSFLSLVLDKRFDAFDGVDKT
jgi:hypothetical protein